jgi:lysophospholipase L1-like esterase
MEKKLNDSGSSVRVIENCLNGRRTVWDDPFKEGRNGLVGLKECIEMSSPLTLVVLMLGINDFQSIHPHNAWHSAQGIAALVTAIRQAPIEPGMPIPPVLIVTPPPIDRPKGPVTMKFLGADAKCAGLSDAYREVAETLHCHYFDAAKVTTLSRVDGVHLDADQHSILGEAIAEFIIPLL